LKEASALSAKKVEDNVTQQHDDKKDDVSGLRPRMADEMRRNPLDGLLTFYG
jgi:hypothetical protein